MTDKTEAQPEALRLEVHQECADFATSLRSAANVVQLEGKNVPPSFLRAADLFEQAASEIQQLKELNARLQPTIEDGSQEWAKCDPAIAFHLIDRHSDNWADAGKMMTEFADAKAELKLKALRDELTAQTNRAAAAEQQVIALTQRLDIANRLNTDARNQLARLSARQAAPDGWRQSAQAVIDRWDSPLWRQEVGTNVLINDLRDMLSAAPPPPEREPLTEQEILEAVSSLYAHPALRSMGAADDIATARAIERAHGIGATND